MFLVQEYSNFIVLLHNRYNFSTIAPQLDFNST